MISIQRKELEFLVQWASSPRRKPLIIRGARQVGKSTLVKLLAKASNLNLIEVNLERNPELIEIFKSNDPLKVMQNLERLHPGQNFDPATSLLFIDEIQQSTDAIQGLRYFYEEMPDLRVVAAGSLLEFTLSEADFPMPVGRIQYMHLGPIKFSDFLLAIGDTNLADFINTGSYQEFLETPDVIHQSLLEKLRTYLLVGGMPEAVSIFAETSSFEDVNEAHQNIMATYRDDFGKYNTKLDKAKIRLAFERLPNLVGQQIKYAHISRDHKSTQIAEAVDLLTQARVIYKVKRTAANGVPMGAEASDRNFKTIFADVGLLTSKLGLRPPANQEEELALVNEGALAEQFVGQHLAYLHEHYREPELYYWAREKHGSSAEVDYIVSHHNKLIPVEVKAGKSGTLKSLHYLLADKQLDFAVRLNADSASALNTKSSTTTNKEFSYTLLSLPLYLVDQLDRILEQAT